MGPPNERGAARDGAPKTHHSQSKSNYSTPSDAGVQELAAHLHSLGARALHEFLLELIAAHGSSVTTRLADYARLTPEMIRATGADRFPPSPIRRVV